MGPNWEAWCLKFDDIDCADFSLVRQWDFFPKPGCPWKESSSEQMDKSIPKERADGEHQESQIEY